jgi:hypothetical protein
MSALKGKGRSRASEPHTVLEEGEKKIKTVREGNTLNINTKN